MKLYVFKYDKDEGKRWQCAALDAGEACQGLAKFLEDAGNDLKGEPLSDNFSLECNGEVAIVEVYSDGSGVGLT